MSNILRKWNVEENIEEKMKSENINVVIRSRPQCRRRISKINSIYNIEEKKIQRKAAKNMKTQRRKLWLKKMSSIPGAQSKESALHATTACASQQRLRRRKQQAATAVAGVACWLSLWPAAWRRLAGEMTAALRKPGSSRESSYEAWLMAWPRDKLAFCAAFILLAVIYQWLSSGLKHEREEKVYSTHCEKWLYKMREAMTPHLKLLCEGADTSMKASELLK